MSIILFLNCTSNKEKGSLNIQASVLKKATKVNFFDTIGFSYPIKIELINSTDTLIEFMSMNCSWTDNWINNSKSSVLGTEPCDKNFLEKYSLNPGQKIEFEGSITTIDTLLKNNKLGFILLKDNEASNFSEFRSVIKQKAVARKDIFWSNEFVLN